MMRMVAMLFAILVFGPAAMAEEGKKSEPAAETDASSKQPKADDLSDIEGGFSIPAADSDSKEKDKK